MAVPTVTTQAVSSITSMTATGNGNITATGGASPFTRGVAYLIGSSGDPDTTGTLLKSAEVTNTGNPAIAFSTFTAVDKTGLTKANGYLKIDLKCDNPSLITTPQLEMTSSGTYDSEEWNTNLSGLDITTSYKTFYIPLANWGSTGTLDVTQIDYMRWYAFSSGADITIAWRNAYIIKDTYFAQDHGTYSTGAFMKGLTGLTADTAYRVRAFAINADGVGVGSTVGFTTALDYELLCAVAAYTLTGINTIFNKAIIAILAVGSFTLTGIDILLNRGKAIICSVGKFILSGVDVIFGGGGSWKWKAQTKHTSTFIQQNKNTSIWTNQDKS